MSRRIWSSERTNNEARQPVRNCIGMNVGERVFRVLLPLSRTPFLAQAIVHRCVKILLE